MTENPPECWRRAKIFVLALNSSVLTRLKIPLIACSSDYTKWKFGNIWSVNDGDKQ